MIIKRGRMTEKRGKRQVAEVTERREEAEEGNDKQLQKKFKLQRK